MSIPNDPLYEQVRFEEIMHEPKFNVGDMVRCIRFPVSFSDQVQHSFVEHDGTFSYVLLTRQGIFRENELEAV